MPVGPRITTDNRYIKHPPVSDWNWRDGRPVDSGTAHIVHSNLSTLSARNRRHIGSVLGPGAIRGYDITKEDGYSLNTVIDASAPTDTNDPLYSVRRIAWVQGFDCLCLGPFMAAPLILNTSPPGYTPPAISGRLVYKYNSAGTASATIYFVVAVTQGPAPPNINDPLKFGTTAPSGYGDYDSVVQVSLIPPVRPRRSMQSRAGGAPNATTSLIDLYVWLGWFSTNDQTTLANRDCVYSFDAWEDY